LSYTDDDERRARIELMIADTEDKRATSDYKRGLRRFEPWKLAVAAFGAGAAFVAAPLWSRYYFAHH
jgi:hypothetical protein